MLHGWPRRKKASDDEQRRHATTQGTHTSLSTTSQNPLSQGRPVSSSLAPLRMLTLPTCFQEQQTAKDQVYRLHSLEDSESNDASPVAGEEKIW